MITPRRPVEDDVTHVRVICTLVTEVPVLGVVGTAAEQAAREIVADEIEQFCADYGWQRSQLTTIAAVARA